MKKISINKFLQPRNYMLQLLRLANYRFCLQNTDIVLAPNYNASFKNQPIFFLGAPRSGSTLIYQVVTDAFDVAYMSNHHCQWFGSPALAEKLFHPLKNKTPSDYSSYHGKTEGYSSPSECGNWWYRFFSRDLAYVTLADVDKKKMHDFRRSLLALSEASDKPLVFKNLYASLRLEAISKYVPEALFIVIKRSELDNAHSILEGRMKALGCYDQWWSLPPPNVEQLKLLKPAQQAVEQVRAVHNLIDHAIENNLIDSSKVLNIQYEQFCDDVHGSVHKVEQFFSTHGLKVSRRFDVPARFSTIKTIRIEKKIYSELQEIAEN